MLRAPSFIIAFTVVVATGCGSDDDRVSGTPSVTAASASDTATPSAVETTTSSRPPPDPGTVAIVDFDFEPSEITIARGETVTWRNEDPYAHWVVSTDPDVLDSGELSQAQSYSETFSQARTVDYYCKIHNYMKATVTVR